MELKWVYETQEMHETKEAGKFLPIEGKKILVCEGVDQFSITVTLTVVLVVM